MNKCCFRAGLDCPFHFHGFNKLRQCLQKVFGADAPPAVLVDFARALSRKGTRGSALFYQAGNARELLEELQRPMETRFRLTRAANYETYVPWDEAFQLAERRKRLAFPVARYIGGCEQRR